MAERAPLQPPLPAKVRHLVIVLGDQLDAQSSALQGFDATQDVLWMAEVVEESTHVWSAKQRIAVFLSAMRHFAENVRERDLPLVYARMDEPGNLGTLPLELGKAIAQLQRDGAAGITALQSQLETLDAAAQTAAMQALVIRLRSNCRVAAGARL